jgi:hypothetical protein
MKRFDSENRTKPDKFRGKNSEKPLENAEKPSAGGYDNLMRLQIKTPEKHRVEKGQGATSRPETAECVILSPDLSAIYEKERDPSVAGSNE